MQKRHREKYRARAIEHMGGKCCQCGSLDDLEFDHIDRTTRVLPIADAIVAGWSWARLLVELAKCQLLCGPCHDKKSVAAGDNPTVEHGGGVSGKRNCKCGPCKAKKNEYMREYKRRRRSSPG